MNSSDFNLYRQNGRVVPAFWVIVSLRDGAVRAVTWDPNALDLCTDELAPLGNFCSVAETACTGITTNCDITVYVVWEGTDLNGRFLSSRQDLLSSYRRFSTASVYNNVLESVQTSVSSATTSLTSATS